MWTLSIDSVFLCVVYYVLYLPLCGHNRFILLITRVYNVIYIYLLYEEKNHARVKCPNYDCSDFHVLTFDATQRLPEFRLRSQFSPNLSHFVVSLVAKFLFACALLESVERASPGEEVAVSIPAVAARSLLVGSVSE